MTRSEARRELITKMLRGYYRFGRVALLVVFMGMMALPHRARHVADVLLFLVLWCLPLWVRRRLLPAARTRDPAFADDLERALADVDAERSASVLPWVRMWP